jgi:phage tail protein X
VQPNDDLRQICLRHLGKFDLHVVEEIHELNPDVTNLDQIVVGQHIILPMASQTK